MPEYYVRLGAELLEENPDGYCIMRVRTDRRAGDARG
jgi:hypothetical protein